MSNSAEFKADFLLLLTAFIWGFAFVFQRTGMDYIGPYTFVFGRFFVASLAMLPLWYLVEKPTKLFSYQPYDGKALQLGLIMLVGMFLQQVGLVHTTVSRAGFLTSIYIIFVPLLGLFLGIKTQWPTWIGVVFALVGLYFLSQIDVNAFLLGDILILLSSVLWAIHVIYTGRVANKVSVFRLIFLQFAVCTLASAIVMVIVEHWDWQAIKNAMPALLFVGVLSSCVGFSLQVIGMRTAPASHTALILSFEAVCAAVGGWWLLAERLTSTELIGCALILVGGLVSQLKLFVRDPSTNYRL